MQSSMMGWLGGIAGTIGRLPEIQDLTPGWEMARFFKRQVLASNVLLHYLLPERLNNGTIRSLRNSQPFPSITARTNKFYKSFLPNCLKNFI